MHTRLGRFRGDSQLTTWLFGICLRVVAAHRRRAWFRRETPTADLPDAEAMPASGRPDAALAEREAQAALRRVLDAMDLEKRAVLVMFDVDELPGEEIAAILGVPIGTVWSRLSAARKQFQKDPVAPQGRPRRGRMGEPKHWRDHGPDEARELFRRAEKTRPMTAKEHARTSARVTRLAALGVVTGSLAWLQGVAWGRVWVSLPSWPSTSSPRG